MHVPFNSLVCIVFYANEIMKQNGGTLHPIGNAIFSLYALERSTRSNLGRKLKEVPGIEEVNVNYAADIVQIRFDPAIVTSDDIRSIMNKLGNVHH